MPRPKVIDTPHELFNRQREAILMRAVRSALGLSQRNLAALVGVHFTTIANLEAAHSRVKPATLEAIRRVYRDAGVVFMIGTDGAIRIEIGQQVIEELAKNPNVSL